MSQYIIGIDLGTTNIAVSYLNAEEAEEAVPELFAIIQITDQGERDERATLPSFLYLPDDKEVSKKALDLPWAAERDYCVGAFARKNAQLLPGKVISSAKSWLCAQNVDPDSKTLPWNHEDPSRKISPVTAAQRFLEHLRDAWNDSIGADDAKAKFQKQEIVLTVPASFDAVARDMTMQAAKKARLEVTLLEEPQAAFYAWLQAHNENWRDRVAAGELILVCDIGGGTTDFSLIKVTDEGGDLDLQRVAVGNHILLGGDNMDLAMAYGVAARLLEEKGMKLDQYQIAGLTHACREAKEVLCADANAGPQKLTVLGRGSSVVGGTITTEVTMEQMQESLVDGFFPLCNIDDSPQQSTKAGLRTFGLDYEADPAVTKHLAAFLSRHGDELPGAILFNGGVTKANALTSRIVETINSWRGKKDLTVLEGTDADLAVAHGACWYGRATPFASAPPARIPTTLLSNPRCRRSPAFHRRSTPFASFSSAWKKAPPRKSRTTASASSSAKPRSSNFSAPLIAPRTTPEKSCRPPITTTCTICPASQPSCRLRTKTLRPARLSRCGSAPCCPKSARCSSGASRKAAVNANGSSNTKFAMPNPPTMRAKKPRNNPSRSAAIALVS